MKRLICIITAFLLMFGCAVAETVENPVDKLTESPLDGGLVIEGVFYQMPIKVQELLDNGWTMDGEDKKIAAGSVVNTIIFYKDNLTFDTHILNDFSSARLLSECHVCKMSFGPDTFGYLYNDNYDLINVKFAKDVDINSSLDDLTKILGEPSSTAGGMITWRGENAKYFSPGHNFTMVPDAQTGGLRYFSIEYVPADFVAE